MPAVRDYEDQDVRGELVAIAEQHSGVLSPESVVQRAADPASKLHSLFEWDDSQAAAKFRLVQAGALIRRVKISVVRASTDAKVMSIETTRAFVAPVGERRSKNNPSGGYAQIESVMADSDRRAALLSTAKADLQAVRRKYEALAELAEVWTVIDKL